MRQGTSEVSEQEPALRSVLQQEEGGRQQWGGGDWRAGLKNGGSPLSDPSAGPAKAVAPSLTPPQPPALVLLLGPPQSRPGHLGPGAHRRGYLVPPPQRTSKGSPPTRLRTTGPCRIRRSAPLSHTPAKSPSGLAPNLAVTPAPNQSVGPRRSLPSHLRHSHHVLGNNLSPPHIPLQLGLITYQLWPNRA